MDKTNVSQYLALMFALLLTGWLGSSAYARSGADIEIAENGRYVVLFEESPVLEYDGSAAKSGGVKMDATRPVEGQRFDATAKAVVAYDRYLSKLHDLRKHDFEKHLGREIVRVGDLTIAANAMIVALEPEEIAIIKSMPGVRAVIADRRLKLETDAGPEWIGAPQVWAGSESIAGTRGEGVVVGVLDSGVNWDHPAYADPAPDGYDHVNPLGSQIGLCSQSSVACNDKLIGVFNFSDEGTNGKDVDGHGTHVSSTAVGNPRMSVVGDGPVTLPLAVSGVAPRANLISYKVCRADDPDTEADEDGCSFSAILDALDRVAGDGVDIINYSIGQPANDPWGQGSLISSTVLNVRTAGILFVTSAGNDGPLPQTVGGPANAPWAVAVANITHDRQFSNVVEDMIGGNSTPPADLLGAGFTDGVSGLPIVHARDFGNALCGAGDPELQSTCELNTGASNPFAPGTFNGQIVVCDRGTYGRIEKGKNVLLAGAAGYVLANTAAQGASTVGDEHCLPGVHLGDERGDELRAWLDDGGSDHRASISGVFQDRRDELGDVVAGSSSRGPAEFVRDVMKPDISAPGSNILAAAADDNGPQFLTGTSMASPHVAGAGALLLSARPGLTPDQIHSLLLTTARSEGMLDSGLDKAADRNDVGAGRLRVDLAVTAGLYLPVSTAQFLAANPSVGGDPRALNLPGLSDEFCLGTCTFNRTLRALDRSATWTAGFDGPDGMIANVTPSSFTLSPGEPINLTITVDVSGSPQLLGNRAEGYVVLTSNADDMADTRLPVSVFSTAGDLPDMFEIDISSRHDSAFVDLGELLPLPEADYDTFGLSRLEIEESTMPQDGTRNDRYDNLANGVRFHTVTVSQSGGVVFAETVPVVNGDLDLFVGIDGNGNGQPDEDEELCASTSPGAREQCIIEDAVAGTYWVLVQNWQSATPGSRDLVRARFAAVDPVQSSLTATGPGELDAQEDFSVRLIWDEGRMLDGQSWIGYLLPKAVRGKGQGVLGRIPVILNFNGDESTGTPADLDLDNYAALALRSGVTETISLQIGEGHGRAFIDVVEQVSALQIQTESTADVDVALVREDFEFAPPGVPVVSGEPSALETGPGGTHAITFANPDPGRYYVVVRNNQSFAPAEAHVTATIEPRSPTIEPVPGLYFNPDRNGAGFNLNVTAGQLIIEWYTYLEDGTPTWYLAQAGFPQLGNRWEADLLYFNWNGSSAEPTVVGAVSLSFVSPTEAVFSFKVNGVSSSESYVAIVPDPSCSVQGPAAEFTGLWFVPDQPGYGYSILSLAESQVHINYLYDDMGFPRWVLGQADVGEGGELPVSQFDGFCPTCEFVAGDSVAIGSNQVLFDDNASGSIVTEVEFVDGLPGDWMASGEMSNLAPTFQCDNG